LPPEALRSRACVGLPSHRLVGAVGREPDHRPLLQLFNEGTAASGWARPNAAEQLPEPASSLRLSRRAARDLETAPPTPRLSIPFYRRDSGIISGKRRQLATRSTAQPKKYPR